MPFDDAAWRARMRADFPCPQLAKGFTEYESPVTGKMITSRAERREDLAKAGCREWEPDKRWRDRQGRWRQPKNEELAHRIAKAKNA